MSGAHMSGARERAAPMIGAPVRYTTRHRRRVTMLAGAALSALALLGACGGGTTGLDDLTGPTSAGGGTTATRNDPTLVGTWSRILVLTDPTNINTSETRWTFFGDGTVQRQIIASNLGAGVGDVITTQGSWTTSGGVVTIVMAPPDSATLQFGYGVQGDTLTLGTLTFTRVVAG